MNKENNVNHIANKLEDLAISTKNRRVTRSTSRAQPNYAESSKETKSELQIATKKISSEKMKKINLNAVSAALKEISIEKNKVINHEKSITLGTSTFQSLNVDSSRVHEDKSNSLPAKKIKEKKLNKILEVENFAHIEEVENLVCRESEKAQITNFLVTRFESGINANLYISGSPGTGKTAVVTSVLNLLKAQKKCHYHLTTCMDFSQPMCVFTDIWNKLSGHEQTNTTKAATEIENYLRLRAKADRPVVIVLDEVDQLTSTNQRILYKIFKWVELANCRLITIGIANTLDLTETKLPDLILESYRPHHINFQPYTQSELDAILMSRVKVELTPSELLAVKLCSKKVASTTGDARKAIDLYKCAAAISEGDQLLQMKSESIDKEQSDDPFRTPVKKLMNTPQLLSARRAQCSVPSSPSINHVSRAIREVEKIADPYKHIVSADTGESTLPLHHKLVLCAAYVLSRDKRKNAPTLGELCSLYSKICDSQNIGAFDMSDVVNICDLLDARALIRVRAHKQVRQKTFTINLDANSIESALADNCLLTSVLAKFCP